MKQVFDFQGPYYLKRRKDCERKECGRKKCGIKEYEYLPVSHSLIPHFTVTNSNAHFFLPNFQL